HKAHQIVALTLDIPIWEHQNDSCGFPILFSVRNWQLWYQVATFAVSANQSSWRFWHELLLVLQITAWCEII
ncbi:MAG: hypothetical protein VX998_00680, partial [Candidatus Thermoplasmatota archaeon]|nr:hypothetical protein [Candidatus Thermoplasmatota archaeon]